MGERAAHGPRGRVVRSAGRRVASRHVTSVQEASDPRVVRGAPDTSRLPFLLVRAVVACPFLDSCGLCQVSSAQRDEDAGGGSRRLSLLLLHGAGAGAGADGCIGDCGCDGLPLAHVPALAPSGHCRSVTGSPWKFS